jgi:hypothetical protein
MSQARTAVRVRSRPDVLGGLGAGILAALAMAMFAMIASATYHGTGLFTPMYHIAASVLSPDAMMASVAEAEAGNAFHFVAGPAVVGLLLHMAVGALFGAVFPLVGAVVGARGAAWIPLGVVYGVAVLLVMSFAGLPIVAALFGGGDATADMPEMAGWWTFTIEHLLFGFVLGVILAFRERAAR